MSLTVPPDLLARAERGDVDDEAFVACIRESLPFAHGVVAGLAGRLPAAEAAGAGFVANETEPGRGGARPAAARARQ